MQSKISSVHNTQVDLSGLMTVLSKHLYSTPMVALRELVQNACDSLVRRRLETQDFQTGSIRVQGDLGKGTLRITDTGAGLTEEEIHRYLATVGTGYTRTLRESTDNEDLIGLFGLGFLSAFVLADKVSLTTTSCHQPDQTWAYHSLDGRQYWVTEKTHRPEIGTVVELQLRKEFKHLAGRGAIETILEHYCILLRDPIYLGEDDKPLNDLEPPWRRDPEAPKEHPALARRRCLEFASRFEERFEPVCTITVQPRGESDACGLLWIQGGSSWASSDNRKLSVFVRGMLLDDDSRDLLPAWAGFVGGVLESRHLTPTASREDLQRDFVYEAVQEALEEALIGGMALVAKEDPAAWRRILNRHNEALLGAALCDPRLFELLAPDLQVPASQGDLPVQALVSRGVIHVASGDGGFEETLFHALGVPVARGDRYAVLPFLREWVNRHGGQLVEVGTTKGNQQLFRPGTLSAEEAAWLGSQLCDGETLMPAHFAPAELPLVVVPDREAEIKRRLEADEADSRISVAALRLARACTATVDGSVESHLYLNLDCPAIRSVLQAWHQGLPGAGQAARLLWASKVALASRGKGFKLDLNKALKELGQAVSLLAGV